ncbi:hypothetical protein BH10BDE1_BH10BDE1_33690 [soil metagenome]
MRCDFWLKRCAGLGEAKLGRASEGNKLYFKGKFAVVTVFAFFVAPTSARADEVNTPHRLMSGRYLEIVTNAETGYLGWVLKDRSRQQVGYGDLKDVAFNDARIGFENPLGWDIKIDIVALKFSNDRQVILFIKDRILKRGPEIAREGGGLSDAPKKFDFKLLKREKKITVLTYEDPKKPTVYKTYSWNGSDFIGSVPQ